MAIVIISLQNGVFLHDFSRQDNTHIIKRSGLPYEHQYSFGLTVDALFEINFVVIFLSAYPIPISCNVCNSNLANNHVFGHDFSFDFKCSS